MRSLIATLQQITAPMGAGPNAPAGSFGPVIPPAVAAFYAPDRVVACLQLRSSANSYTYLALVVPTIGTPFMAVGGIESVFLQLRESYRVRPSAGVTNLEISGPLLIDGISAPRGVRMAIASQANSGSFGTGAASVLSMGDFIFRAGRAYKVTLFGGITTSTDDTQVRLSLFSQTIAADILQAGANGPTGPDAFQCLAGWTSYIRNATGADITHNLIIAGITSSGTAVWNGSAVAPRGVAITDYGAAADYPNVATV